MLLSSNFKIIRELKKISITFLSLLDLQNFDSQARLKKNLIETIVNEPKLLLYINLQNSGKGILDRVL